VTRSSPTTLLWPKKGAGRLRRAQTAAQGGAGRCGSQSGMLDGNARRLGPREGVLACGEGLGAVGRLGEQAEGELAMGAPMAGRWPGSAPRNRRKGARF
jgi:hypothetical protein